MSIRSRIKKLFGKPAPYDDGFLDEKGLADRQLKVAESDQMPAAVATAFLTVPGRRMSNRERKVYLRARERSLVSTRQGKPLETQLANKLNDKSFRQLAIRVHRAQKHRRGVQAKYEKVQALKDSPVKERAKNALDLRALMIDTFLDAAETLLEWRGKVATGSAQGAEKVGILRCPVTGRTFIWTEALEVPGLAKPRRSEFPRWVRREGGK